jgi:ABC-2 type transport system permease protein
MTAFSATTAPTMPPGHVSAAGALWSEWTKLRSVRSTAWSLVALVLVGVGIAILGTSVEASHWSHADIGDKLTFDPTNLSLTGLFFGQLAIGVLGVLAMSAEYGTGTIRATLAAIPRRPMVLAAKAAVFGLVAFVVGEIVAFAAFFVGQAILSGSTPTASLGQPNVLRAVIGGGLFITVLGLLALGLATIIRHTAGAIAAFVGVVLVLPLVIFPLPSSFSHAVLKYLPSSIGGALTATHAGGRDFPMFSPWVGFAVLCAYAAAALVIGGLLMVRRDA